MTDRKSYLAAAIRLYLDSPGAPRRASRSDWAVANTLYHRGVSLETLAHVVRLAALRRRRPDAALEPVHSLAYYRRVLDQITPDALESGYVDYIARTYEALFGEPVTCSRQGAVSLRQNPALSDRR